MGKIVDLVGKKFGRWTVLGLSNPGEKVLYWDCMCECGQVRPVFGGDLKRGGSLSCGCLMRERNGAKRMVHGNSHHPSYKTWIYMRSRCENENDTGYYGYGAKGISVCERWKSYANFWEDMGPTWRRGLSIDRINPLGNYEPSNCRWASALEQGNNRSTNHMIKTPKGDMTVTQAARAFGLKAPTLFSRIRCGVSDDQLLKPVERPRNTNLIHIKNKIAAS